jgi:putative ABC transport system permease protein
MDIIESVKMATTTLTSNKLRSALTMLGIIIGNASVIAMIGIGQGAQNFMVGKLESFGANRLIIFNSQEDTEGLTKAQESRLVLSDVDAIAEQVPAVSAVSPAIQSQFSIGRGSKQVAANAFGTTPELLTVMNFTIGQGKFLDKATLEQNAQVVALGPEIARKLFGNENPVGKEVQINNLSFVVIGVMQPKGSFAGDNPDEWVFVPITTMASQLAGRKSPYGIPVDYIQATAIDQENIRTAAFQINNVLTRVHGKKDFTVVASKSFQDLIGQVTGALSMMLAAIAGISLLVGGIGIMNIMLVSVTERTGEIGLRKAIGATQREILTQFIIEAVILSIAGGVIGTAVGIGGSMAVGLVTPLKPTVPVGAIVLAMGVSGSIGLIFGVVPARQAAKLDPIVALRSA